MLFIETKKKNLLMIKKLYIIIERMQNERENLHTKKHAKQDREKLLYS